MKFFLCYKYFGLPLSDISSRKNITQKQILKYLNFLRIFRFKYRLRIWF